MNYLFIAICIISFIIIILLKQTKKVKPSEAYIIERNKKFFKVVSSGFLFMIPFLDKIKCVVNLNPQIKKCYPTIAILSDNNVISFKIDILFKVIDAKKAAYQEKNLEAQLEYLAITSFRAITQKMDSSKIKYLNDKVKYDLKSTLNRTAYNLGCEIDEVKVELIDNLYEFDIKNYAQSSVVDCITYQSKLKTYLVIIAFFIAYFSLGFFLQDTYSKTSNLLFYFFKIILKSSLTFLGCLYASFFTLSLLKKQNNSKKMLGNIIGVAIIFLCIYDILAEPNRISISDGRTSMLNYKYSILSDIIANQTTTIQSSEIYTEKNYTGKHYCPACIRYKTENAQHTYSSEATNTLVSTVNSLKLLEDTVKIEYYNNSKIIKSIDGIDKFDYDNLEKRVLYLKEKKSEELKQEQIKEEKLKQEQEEKEQQERQLRTNIYIIKQNSIGKNIEDVKKELSEIGISDVPIKYIGSKFYSIGTVAFAERDGENFSLNTLYVVGNNNSEDLTKMPQLKAGMVRDEIVNLFDQKGLNYKFITLKTNDALKEKGIHGLYMYVPPGTGTYVPKGLLFTITIYE